MHAINDPHDDMLLAPRDTTVVTQATAANDTFPAPYDLEEGANILSDDEVEGFGDVQSARKLRDRIRNRSISRPSSRPTRASHRGYSSFLFGLGDRPAKLVEVVIEADHRRVVHLDREDGVPGGLDMADRPVVEVALEAAVAFRVVIEDQDHALGMVPEGEPFSMLDAWSRTRSIHPFMEV